MTELPDDYRTFIHRSRYSRFRDDLGRRETWEETVDRLIDFWRNRLSTDDEQVLSQIREAILNCDIMPSMRSLMTAGKALDRDNVAGYNCFAGEQEFITDAGLRSFAECTGKTVNVLAGDGEYRPAKVRSFGKQPMTEVVLRHSKKSNKRTKVKVTPDHKWITNNRGEVTDLRVGDSLPTTAIKDRQGFNLEAWIYGFGFGDGTVDTRGRAKVRLCGEKDMQYLPYFEEYGHSSICTPPSYNGDAVVIFHQGHMNDWKSLPYEMQFDIEWVASWIEGYLAADGCLRESQPTLSSQNHEAIDFVSRYGPMCGYIVTGDNLDPTLETNYGPRANSLRRITVRDESVFYVESITEAEEEECFCVTEPVTHSFTLANGVKTGNCAYLPIEDLRCFDELMYILLCGTGVGFSVERQYVNRLPVVSEEFHKTDTVIHVSDSKIGWASAFRELVSLLYAGKIPKWDVSRIRPAGSRLRVFGGRASGPEPLVDLFNFTIRLITNAAGRKLTSIECHDLVCKVADIVVVGGVRRSALISLSNLSDDRMRGAKSGQWWEEDPQRRLANNSYVADERPDFPIFMSEWSSLYESKSGERGIFSRRACKLKAGENGRRETDHEFGTNPCSEIILRPYEFCNLTEVVVRPNDSISDLRRKVQLATILGTLQSTLTDFRYLRKKWKNNCEEERLLGVSLTGICDHPTTSGSNDGLAYDSMGIGLEDLLKELKKEAIETNAEWADYLGINPSAAITCVKPSGTVSQLVDSASGIHPRFSRYYIRRVRNDRKDPITQFLIDQGVPSEVDVMNKDNVVFSFPMKAPDTAVCAEEMDATTQLNLWKVYAEYWCEHKPSMTAYYKDDDFLAVGQWLWSNFDSVSGVSFLPYSDHVYQQAPYEAIDEETYNELVGQMPSSIDWLKLANYESDDNTVGSQEFACTGNSCEVV